MLETKLVAREPAVVTISKEAKELISVGHSSSQTIHERKFNVAVIVDRTEESGQQ